MMNKSAVIEKSNLYNNYDLAELQKVCSKLADLVVGLYDVENQKFEYCSQSVKQLLGYKPEKLIGSGWDFWYSLLKPTERPVIQHKLANIFVATPSTKHKRKRFGIKYHMKTMDGNWIYVKHEIRHKCFNGQLLALNMVHDNSEYELLDHYFGSTQHISRQSNYKGIRVDISDREKQVLRLIACGLSSRQIAKKLFISRHTVISHRKNLIKKFGVKNTAELIKEASKVIEL